jgi:basic membrane protein A
MMKKGLLFLLVFSLISFLAACGTDGDNAEGGEGAAEGMKVGMVTDAGTIDDKSFNQGTWEGILQAADELGVSEKYLKPAGTTEADYLKEIGNLYDAGYKFIITPGYKFETAVFQAQDKYKDAKFVIIDGAPHAGDYNINVKENTVSIFFAEHESGFLAGVAAAIELKDAEAGFIGGMEIPAVQKFNWGFQQGIQYANENLGTNLSMKPENVVYQGSFDNVSAGQQLAAQMYDSGVNVIFTAAGGVGVGAINEAKTRAKAGNEAWVVGVDVDQYGDGVYEDNKSVILTSAMKRLGQVAYDMIQEEINGSFPGGKTLIFDTKNNGVGIPEENPNLSEETVSKTNEVLEKIKSGEITVSPEQGDLLK